MASQPMVQFFDGAGHANVRRHLDALLSSATISFKGAVCYFTKAGYVLLKKHIFVLRRPDSFFVASIDRPTNLKALLQLHLLSPRNIYIHMGGTTPEEIHVGHSLMHSKLLLAAGVDERRLAARGDTEVFAQPAARRGLD